MLLNRKLSFLLRILVTTKTTTTTKIASTHVLSCPPPPDTAISVYEKTYSLLKEIVK